MYLYIFGVGAGAVIGGGYSYRQFLESQKPITVNQQEIPVLKEFPGIKVLRSVTYSNYKSNLRLYLFQYANCPYSCKVKAFLEYYGLPYDVIDVEPLARKKIKWSYKKSPIIIVHEEDKYAQLDDSGLIISALASYFTNKESNFFDILQNYPYVTFKENGRKKTEILNQYFLMNKNTNLNVKTIMLEARWRTWVNESLIPMLILNVYRTPSEALKTFRWFSDKDQWNKSLPMWKRISLTYLGSFTMWMLSKNLKRKQENLKDDVRESLYEECKAWLQAIHQQGRQFLGGEVPNLADIEVYGVFSSIEGSEAFDDVAKHTNLEKWYWAVHMHVKKNKGRVFLQR